MDDRKHPPSLPDLDTPLGFEATAIAAEVSRPSPDDTPVGVPARELSPTPAPCEGSQVVYCGNVELVPEGFAIALCAMGVEANFLPGDSALPATSPNREGS